MAGKKITQLNSGSLSNLPLSGVTAVVYSGLTLQHSLSDLRLKLVDSGSHNFTGNQTITGSLLISGSATYDIDVIGSIRTSGPNTNILVSGSTGRSHIGQHEISIISNSNSPYLSTEFGGNLGVFNLSNLTEIGIALNGSEFSNNWSNGPVLYVNNDSEDSYDAVFGFQNKTGYTDGRITLLKNTDLSGSLNVINSGSYNIAHFQGNYGYYSQINVTNTNSGSLSSTDIVATADNGNETVHFVNLGINSSTYNGGYVGYENDAYLLNVGKDLYIGTIGGVNHPAKLHLFAENNWENPQITIHTGSQVTFNTSSFTEGFTYEFSGSVKLKNQLKVDGSITSSYFVGDGSQLTNLPVQTVNTGSLATTGSNTFVGNQIISGSLNIATNGGDEGGEILLGRAITNTTLTGSGVVMDVYRDSIRFFEQSGSSRGAFLDITKQSNAVSSQIVTSPNLFSIQTITSASYASLTPVSGTLYIIID
jgi:hypothetical protein